MIRVRREGDSGALQSGSSEILTAKSSRKRAELQLKKPQEEELHDIDFCINHCPNPEKACSGSERRLEKCKREFERRMR